MIRMLRGNGGGLRVWLIGALRYAAAGTWRTGCRLTTPDWERDGCRGLRCGRGERPAQDLRHGGRIRRCRAALAAAFASLQGRA